MSKKVSVITLLLLLILITGCSNEKCVKSHKEKSTCVYYTYVYSGKVLVPIPHYYVCEKTVCDEYESEVEDNEKI